MDSETRSAVRIFVVLTVAATAVVAWWTVREARRPHLEQVRVVFRAAGEPVASDAFRPFPAGTMVEAAAVVTYRRGNAAPRHLCPLSPVAIGGRPLEVEPLSAWPASGGELRATWYTVEPSLLGWQEVGPESADKLAYRDFLASELGRGLLVRLDFEARNDDFLARKVPGNALPGGIFRFKVRVGNYRRADDLVAAESVSSPGAAEVFAGQVPAVAVQYPFPAGIAAVLSHRLRLGCFTFRPEVWRGGGGWPLPLSPLRLVAEGYVTTPEAFAAAALGGTPEQLPWASPVLLAAGSSGWQRDGKPLRWGVDVAAGDALRRGSRYAVVLADDGDDVLSFADTAVFAWGEPARIAPVVLALGGEAAAVELLRRAR